MTEDQVRQIIRQELSNLLGTDRYTFQKHLQIFDGRNVQLGRTAGTTIGTATDQLLGFYGVTPIIQPTVHTGSALNDIMNALVALGLVNKVLG